MSKLAVCLITLTLAGTALAFAGGGFVVHLGRGRTPRLASTAVRCSTAPCKPSQVFVENDADAVAAHMLERVEEAAEIAIAERGHFALAIPGGSVLKMLAKSSPKWAGQTTLAFVNHKAVPVDDESLSTLAKARKLFLSEWEALGCNVVPLDGSSDAEAEAAAYQSKLQSLAQGQLPRVNASAGEELAVFDLMLIGVGDDGHIGSLYPDRPEVLDTTGRWVLPVSKKSPGSITLSLPLMLAARQVVVAACGVSDKYPKGKSDAMARAIEEDVSPASFPAAALRARADWVLDVAAAGKLSFDYAQCFTFRGNRGDCCPP